MNFAGWSFVCTLKLSSTYEGAARLPFLSDPSLPRFRNSPKGPTVVAVEKKCASLSSPEGIEHKNANTKTAVDRTLALNPFSLHFSARSEARLKERRSRNGQSCLVNRPTSYKERD